MGQNPHLCESGQCNEKEKGKGEDKKNTVTPVVASVGGVVIILLAVAAILWTLKRRNSKGDAYSDKNIFIDNLPNKLVTC